MQTYLLISAVFRPPATHPPKQIDSWHPSHSPCVKLKSSATDSCVCKCQEGSSLLLSKLVVPVICMLLASSFLHFLNVDFSYANNMLFSIIGKYNLLLLLFNCLFRILFAFTTLEENNEKKKSSGLYVQHNNNFRCLFYHKENVFFMYLGRVTSSYFMS